MKNYTNEIVCYKQKNKYEMRKNSLTKRIAIGVIFNLKISSKKPKNVALSM